MYTWRRELGLISVLGVGIKMESFRSHSRNAFFSLIFMLKLLKILICYSSDFFLVGGGKIFFFRGSFFCYDPVSRNVADLTDWIWINSTIQMGFNGFSGEF